LWRRACAPPLSFLLLYAAFAAVRHELWAVRFVVAAPRERYSILGQEYYGFLFPLGILLSSAARHPIDAVVVVAHLLAFPGPAVWFALQTQALARDAVRHKEGPIATVDRWLKQMTASARTRAASFGRMIRAVQWRNYKRVTNTGAPTLEEAVAKAAAFLRERLRSGSYGLAAVGSDGTPRFPDDKGHIFVAWPIT